MEGITTMKKNTVRFTLNFVNQTIVGTKASFDKAGKGTGDVYEELVALIEKHPTFGFEVKKQEPRSAKPKQTYKGMDVPFILDYLTAIDDTNTLAKVNNVIAFAKKDKLSLYPLVKCELFEAHKDFDYNDAKEKVSAYRHKMIVEKATEEAAKKTASTAENKSDLAPAEKAA